MVEYILDTWAKIDAFWKSIYHPKYEVYAAYTNSFVTLVTARPYTTDVNKSKYSFYFDTTGNFSGRTIKSGYKEVNVGTLDKYIISGGTWNRSLNMPNAPEFPGFQATNPMNVGVFNYHVIFCVPNLPQYTASAITSRWQTASTGSIPAPLFNPSKTEIERVVHLNDFSNRKLGYIGKLRR